MSKDYAQMTLRVPPRIKADLEFLGVIEGASLSAIVESATDAYVESRPAATRRALQELRQARATARSKR